MCTGDVCCSLSFFNLNISNIIPGMYGIKKHGLAGMLVAHTAYMVHGFILAYAKKEHFWLDETSVSPEVELNKHGF